MSDALVSTGWLAQRLNTPAIRPLFVASRREFVGTPCIPGSTALYWKDLCWHPTDREMATPEEVAQRLGAAGISDDANIVLYSDTVQYATYAYWTLSMAGVRHLTVLNGSLNTWRGQGHLLSNPVEMTRPVERTAGQTDQSSRIGRDAVRASLGQPGIRLIDARSPEEYNGSRVMPLPGFDHGAERAGRIPGAVSLYFRRLLNDDDTFFAPEQIAAELRQVGINHDTPMRVLLYCRLSHRATLVWFAMTRILGHDNVVVYDGSWTEWGSIVGFPIEV